ncbi:MAG: DUF2085 domain-containing protein [Clostridium sp.]|nr:DUF2085 domain-containing protein [Clostridium sp.]MCM1208210.1 DUF2085 domain-containing protein [Ruminococcus sp.]
MPSRSYRIGSYQFPVCARCMGIIIGYICAVIMLVLKKYICLRTCILLCMPMVIDGGIQFFTKYESKNYRRSYTGFCAGLGFIMILRHIIFNLFQLMGI